MEKTDDTAVQQTNDDSAVSKRSACKHGYVDDPYLRHFVKKYSRRTGLINRGYYLRIAAMSKLVESALEYFLREQQRVQVLSLGAGFDTLAARLFAKPSFANVHFFEVDFPPVIANKSSILRAEAASFPFAECERREEEQQQEQVSEFHCERYHAVGLDLRDAAKDLLPRLTSLGFAHDAPTVVYAECVTQYMNPACSTDLIRWVANTLPCAVLYVYDQIHPSDSFGRVMTASLRSRACPLLGISAFPDRQALVGRATSVGMRNVDFIDFFDVSAAQICGAEKDRVDAIEPFDEFEEWCEMCGHYGVLCASTSDSVEPPRPPRKQHSVREGIRDAAAEEAQSGPALQCRVEPWSTGRYGFEGWGNGGVALERFASGDTALVVAGGFQTGKRSHGRCSDVHVHSLKNGEVEVVVETTGFQPPATVFHTFTRMEEGVYALFGGRTNPEACHNAVAILRIDFASYPSRVRCRWSACGVAPLSSVPVPRYRHAAVCVGSRSLFTFGGKACVSGTQQILLSDAFIGEFADNYASLSWRAVPLSGDVPSPLCSTALFHVDDDTVGICGGMTHDDACTGSMWTVSLQTGVCRQLHALISPRFSHTATRMTVLVDGCREQQAVAIVGGTSFAPKSMTQPVVLLSLPAFAQLPTDLLDAASLPTLTRHCAAAVSVGELAVVGGGFTCFSFGTFSSKPLMLRFTTTSGSHQESQRVADEARHKHDAADRTRLSKNVVAVAFSPNGWRGIEALQPLRFTSTPLGACLERWRDPRYLIDAESSTRVSVHVAHASNKLDFVNKNFAFRHVSFPDLIHHCGFGGGDEVGGNAADRRETWYFRSVAAAMKTDRADFWRDFPALARDFALPPPASDTIMPRVHQSCLRVNAKGMQLWTHYDTLDNVLCQVVGTKRVVLFPPSQYGNLYMVGSSSRVTDIDSPDLQLFPRFADALKAATVAVLQPGDMLFIPSLWFHHVTAVDACISVNVFYERLPKDAYDSKDLYGNKDLPAAVAIRRNAVDMVRRMVFGPLPPVFDAFTLRQIIADLEALADRGGDAA